MSKNKREHRWQRAVLLVPPVSEVLYEHFNLVVSTKFKSQEKKIKRKKREKQKKCHENIPSATYE